MPTWEYLLGSLELENLEQGVKQLNELGEEEWEVVSVLSRNPNLTDLLVLLKRPQKTSDVKLK
jgi:hypothetical protein